MSFYCVGQFEAFLEETLFLPWLCMLSKAPIAELLIGFLIEIISQTNSILGDTLIGNLF